MFSSAVVTRALNLALNKPAYLSSIRHDGPASNAVGML